MFLHFIKQELKEHIQKTFNQKSNTSGLIADSFILVEPPDISLGHLAMGCFPLAKILQTSPQQIAQELAHQFSTKSDSWINKLVNVGAYLNVFLNLDKLGDNLLTEISNNENYGKNEQGKQQTVMVEFSSPNANKPLHLGHCRNNAIGFSLSQLFSYCGFKVICANLINDRGIHICQSMLAYNLFGKGKTPQSEKKKGDHFVGDYYVLFHQEKEKDATLEEQSQLWLQKWEQGDSLILKLWEKLNSWVLAGFQETYNRFGIKFDKYYFESQTYKKGKQEVLQALEKGICYKESNQAIAIDLADENLGCKILLRADGTSVYITQDIYTTIQKFKDYDLSQCIFVVGSEQNFHFKTLFNILKKFGYSWAKNCKHLSYGMISLPEGKMKSRKGKVVDIDDLADEVKDLAYQELKEKQTREDNELQDVAEKIAQAAIKYFILRTNVAKNFLFDPKQSLSFEGNTGPYLQYTYARISSILAKTKLIKNNNNSQLSQNWNTAETNILLSLLKLPELIIKATNDLNPSIIADYSYKLCRHFNRFYYDHPILNSGEAEIKRLRLTFATSKILEKTFAILGIYPLKKM